METVQIMLPARCLFRVAECFIAAHVTVGPHEIKPEASRPERLSNHFGVDETDIQYRHVDFESRAEWLTWRDQVRWDHLCFAQPCQRDWPAWGSWICIP